MPAIQTLKNGILKENPIFVQVIGMCPTLAVTTSVVNAIGMGLSTTAVLIGSNVSIALLRKFIPAKIRIPAFVVVIASFVTIIQFLLKAFLPDINEALGLYIPLIVVNCIILARAEAFASKNTVINSAADGLGMGFGFTLALIAIGFVRELLGSCSILGLPILQTVMPQTLIMIMAPGAFFTLGMLMALLNYLTISQNKKKQKGAF